MSRTWCWRECLAHPGGTLAYLPQGWREMRLHEPQTPQLDFQPLPCPLQGGHGWEAQSGAHEIVTAKCPQEEKGKICTVHANNPHSTHMHSRLHVPTGIHSRTQLHGHELCQCRVGSRGKQLHSHQLSRGECQMGLSTSNGPSSTKSTIHRPSSPMMSSTRLSDTSNLTCSRG